jgi:hypothetical protein
VRDLKKEKEKRIMQTKEVGRIEERRRLYDIWAFVLYLVLGSIGVGMALRKYKSLDMGLTWNLAKCIVVGRGETADYILAALPFAVMTAVFLFGLIGYSLFPRVMLHMAYLASMATTGILAGVSIHQLVKSRHRGNDDFALIASAALSIMVLVVTAIYYFYVRKFIPYMAIYMKNTAAIFRKSALSVAALFLGLHVLDTLMLMSLPVIAAGARKHNLEPGPSAFSFFIIAWTEMAMAYSVRVCVSKMILTFMQNTVYQEKRSLIWSGISRVFWSIGTIFLAGLLRAVVETCKYLIRMDFKGYAGNEDRGRGALIVLFILHLVALIALAILGVIVEMANTFTLAYNSIYGTSYKESVISSIDVFTSSLAGSYPLEAMILSSIGLLSLFSLFTLGFLSWILLCTKDPAFAIGLYFSIPQSGPAGVAVFVSRALRFVVIVATIDNCCNLWTYGVSSSIFIRTAEPELFARAFPETDMELREREKDLPQTHIRS